jgi:5,8-dihydroxy-2-naphthoate synthase
MVGSGERRRIRIGHSPDPDDAFMFHGLASGKVAVPPGWEIVQVLQDIETLNRMALDGDIEVTAVSIHAYAYLTGRYSLLPCGASMGDGYGPMVVAREPLAPADLASRTIAIPGRLTSAALAMRLALGDVRTEVVPFDRILEGVRDGRFEAGLIIHEGQLTYADEGLRKVIDLGAWWKEQTGLPLPLGGNVIRKDLGAETIATLAALLKASIEHGLAHREEALTYAMDFGRGIGRARADRFVGMYVNEWTRDYGPQGREAIALFLERAAAEGIIPRPVTVEFAA